MQWFGRRRPQLSIVVVVHDMPREAPRTLLSLSAGYQRDIGADDYEIIVVDNGSDPPFDRKVLDGLAGDFKLIRIEPAPPSPAHAINRGLSEARGSVIGVMIDGARLVTPGLLHFARHGARLYERAVVTTLGWYLGHDYQSWARQAGYDTAREDVLLAEINWPQDGYRLFEIGTLDESSVDGWLLPIAESNALFLRRETWNLLGGVDERFDVPGGGLVNLDTYRRAMELPGAEQVLLLGEGTFHQLHGGISTNAPVEQHDDNWKRWSHQYETIRGKPWQYPWPRISPTYLGTLPRPALARFVRAAVEPLPRHVEAPLGARFDPGLWSPTPAARSADPMIAGLVELAESEFRARRYTASAAVARLIRQRMPDEPEAQRLLSLVAPWLSPVPPPPYAVETRARAGRRTCR
jgi:hypothetical protein